MGRMSWTEDEARAYLAAMKAVALAGGGRDLEPVERDMLLATARHVLHEEVDIDELEPLTPRRLAETIREADRREQAVQFLILVPYLDGVVDPSQVAKVDEFARVLGVAPDTLTSLHRVRDRRMHRLQVDYLRRSVASDIVPGEGFFGKTRALIEGYAQYRGDAAVARQYYKYERFPRGSLGRVFYDFYRARGFPLPGEKGSFSEILVPHDLVHILGGFNTDMSGELDVAGMEAGMMQESIGYELLLEVILDFHMGLAFTTAGLVEPGLGHFHPDSVMAGFERGSRMNVDLMNGWDWHAVMGEPVVALRERYGILDVAVVEMSPPVQHDAHPAAPA